MSSNILGIMSSEDINIYSALDRLSFNHRDFLGSRIISLGAMILNGFTRERIVGNVIIPTNSKEADNLVGGVYSLKYLENYNNELGFENSNIASPERIICDYFMYPSLQIPQIYDFMESYGNSINWDFSSTYEMMDVFGLNHSLLDKLISEAKMTISGE